MYDQEEPTLAKQLEMVLIKNQNPLPLPKTVEVIATRIPDMSLKSTDQKIDMLISLAQTYNRNMINIQRDHNFNMSTINTELNSIKTDINNSVITQQEKLAFKEQIFSAHGKIIRLEEKESKLKQKVIDLEQQQYKNDLIFYNVPEDGPQTSETLTTTVTISYTNTCRFLQPKY